MLIILSTFGPSSMHPERRTENTIHYAGQHLPEYLLVAYPSTSVYEQLGEEQLELKQWGYAAALKRNSFITLASFQAKEALEATLARWIQNICHLQQSFEVTLNNFSGIPPHTIYLRVQDPQPFHQIGNALKMLDGFIQSNEGPPLSICSKPFLPLATGLPEAIYHELMPVYAAKEFHASFLLEKIVLLRREHPAQFDIINTFTLPPASPV